MKKLLLLTSILTLIFSSFSFAKTYSIKKEKEGKYVEISQGDIEVVLSKGEVFQQQISGNSFINIIKYDKKVFYCFTNVFLTSDVQNVCRTWVSEDKEQPNYLKKHQRLLRVKHDNIRSNISHNSASNKAEATAKACQGKGKKRQQVVKVIQSEWKTLNPTLSKTVIYETCTAI